MKTALTPEDILGSIASKLLPIEEDIKDRPPAWIWKLKFDKCSDEKGRITDHDLWSRTKLELYEELSQAPGEARYVPGTTQFEAHCGKYKIKQVVGGWRGGKSKWMSAELLPFMFVDNAHIWNVANTFDLARPEFSYVVQWLSWLGLRDGNGMKLSQPLVGKWSVKTDWGALFETQTAEDVIKLEAANLNACGVAEAGQINLDVITRVLGRVFEKDGPICESGSFESSLPWYLEQYEQHLNGGDDIRSYSIPSWENRVVFPGGRNDPLIIQQERILPEEVFLLKVAAQPIRGREFVHPEFDPKLHVVPIVVARYKDDGTLIEYPTPETAYDGRISKWWLPQDQIIEVTVDPGFQGAYAVEFMTEDGENVFVVDEVYRQFCVAEEVIAECKQKEIWPRVRSGVIDIAGNQHQGMKSHVETWAERGQANIHLRSQKVSVEEGVKRFRTFLINPMTKKPRFWVDPKCSGIIREFKLYRYPPTRENAPEREKPIDKDNHAIKAISYWLIDKFGYTEGGAQVEFTRYVQDQRSLSEDYYSSQYFQRGPAGWTVGR